MGCLNKKYLIFGVLLLAIASMGCTSEPELDPETQKAVEESVAEVIEKTGAEAMEKVEEASTEATPVQKEYADVTFKKYLSFFGIDGSLTDLQKDKVFESEYKGKYVKWTCTMADIKESIFGSGYYMLLDCPDDPTEFDFDNDVSVTLRKDQTDEAMLVMKGEEVTFEGRFKEHIDLMADVALDDGTIISHE